MYTKIITIAVLVLGCLQTAQAQSGDALDEALGLVGMSRDDLGWKPKGWWTKFPADIPYKLRSFDALFEHPLDTITYTRLLAHAARVHLDPAVQGKLDDRKCSNIYHAAHILGLDPKFGAMRGYATNLPKEDTPLDQAILNLYRAAGRTTKPFTFYMDLPYPQYEKELAEKVQVIPEKARPILGRLIMSIIEAHYWAELAFHNVDGKKRAIVARRYDAGHEEVDAYDYCPEFDDLAQTLDQASLWYAGEKCIEALEDARIALAALDELKNPPPFAFDWRTPWGWIRVRGGGDDQVEGTDALLIVDLGGNDHYTGGVAASTADRPIGLLLDLAGDDHYESDQPAQGAGMCGIGILIDAAGNDEYKAEHYAQGVGQFGLGLLADLSGNDRYFVKFNGQGCGYFGVGELFDCDGHDQYVIYADGQGLGGVSGVGVLADRKGDDTYEAVRDAKITGRPSYHSPNENITVSNAQGCAMGRRGDGCDGHSWAGGLGLLIDIEGDDKYTSGNWSMGTGYWFGTGILYDGSGDDEYRGVCYSQATGAHFCIGVLLDEGGNDKHLAEATSNMCLGWGHDFTIGLLVDIGGDDLYEVKQCGIAYGINRSFAALIDIGGNDTYKSDASLRKVQDNKPGFAKYDPRFDSGTAERPEPGFYFADATSVALFLDIGGKDSYWSGQTDNSQWLDEPGAPNYKVRNFSIGMDRADGVVDFVPVPEKRPTRPPPRSLTTSRPSTQPAASRPAQ